MNKVLFVIRHICIEKGASSQLRYIQIMFLLQGRASLCGSGPECISAGKLSVCALANFLGQKGSNIWGHAPIV